VEINAYADGLPMRRWEKEMIRELDDISRGVWMKQKTGDKEPSLVSLKDTAAVNALFDRFEAKKNRS
jgi:hypothetical protein